MFESSSAPGLHEDLLSQDPGVLGERAKGLQARRDRLEAEEAELLIEVEGLRARGRDYFRDTAAWLRQNTGIARATARTRAHVARQLAALPGARSVWADGRIGFDHARVLADHADSPIATISSMKPTRSSAGRPNSPPTRSGTRWRTGPATSTTPATRACLPWSGSVAGAR